MSESASHQPRPSNTPAGLQVAQTARLNLLIIGSSSASFLKQLMGSCKVDGERFTA